MQNGEPSPLWLQFSRWTSLLLLIIYVVWHRIGLGFWNDELYSLEHFVLVPLETSLWDYHVPNNHILFNLLQNLYLKMIAWQEMRAILESPQILRSLPLLFMLLNMWFLAKVVTIIKGPRLAFLTLLSLLSFIPYQNFALQLRGYGLSVLGVSLIFYGLVLFLKYRNKPSLLWMSLGTFICLYTLPSNIYYLISIAFFILLFHWLYRRILSKKEVVKLGMAFFIGLLLAMVFYIPIFNDVFFNEYVVPGAPFNLNSLVFNLKHFYASYHYGNGALFLLSLSGFAVELLKRKKLTWYTGFSLMLIFFPLLINYIRGDHAPPRVFLPSVLFTSFLMALGLEYFLDISKRLKYQRIAEVLVLILLLGLSTLQRDRYQKEIKGFLVAGQRLQGLLYQYYSDSYDPLKSVKELKSNYDQSPQPVLVLGCEPHGIKHYLRAFDIPYHHDFYAPFATDSTIQGGQGFYLISNQLKPLENQLELELIRISEDSSYHNLYALRPKVAYLEWLSQKYQKNGSIVVNSQAAFFQEQIKAGDIIHTDSMPGSSFLEHKLLFVDFKRNQDGWFLPFIGERNILAHFDSLGVQSIETGYQSPGPWEYIHLSDSATVRLREEDQFYGLHEGSLDRGKRYYFLVEACFSGQADQGLLAYQVDHGEEVLLWKAWHWKDYLRSDSCFQIPLLLSDTLPPAAKFKLYLWSPEGIDITLSNPQLHGWLPPLDDPVRGR